MDDIDWIQANGNYVLLHCGAARYSLRATLSGIGERLDGERFLRVHRTSIVNVDRIHEITPLFHGDFQIVLHDGTELVLSRRYRERLPEALRQGL